MKWNEIVGEAFPEFKGGTLCFSFDWIMITYHSVEQHLDRT